MGSEITRVPQAHPLWPHISAAVVAQLYGGHRMGWGASDQVIIVRGSRAQNAGHVHWEGRGWGGEHVRGL